MSSSTVVSLNPYSGEPVTELPVSSSEELDRAVGAVNDAQTLWGATAFEERSQLLLRAADLLDARADEFRDLIVQEVGKRVAEAAAEVEGTVGSLRYFATQPPLRESDVSGARVSEVALGTLAILTPWNVPLLMPMIKLAPALGTGNGCVWKPSEQAPEIAVRFVGLLKEAGLPENLVRLVHGEGDVGSKLCGHAGIDGIQFIGSTGVGRQIAAAAAARLIPCSLEMGGSNPVVIFADAEAEAVAGEIVSSMTSIQGQKCTSTRRIIAHETVADELAGHLRTRIAELHAGDPSDPAVSFGPLISPRAAEGMRDAVSEMTAAGFERIAESEVPKHPAFAPATILRDAGTGSQLRREVFAPLATLTTFATEERAWELANDSDLGLTSSVYTSDPEVAARGVALIEAGLVNVNRRTDYFENEPPFIGVKGSGFGAPDGGTYAYRGMTTLKTSYGKATD